MTNISPFSPKRYKIFSTKNQKFLSVFILKMSVFHIKIFAQKSKFCSKFIFPPISKNACGHPNFNKPCQNPLRLPTKWGRSNRGQNMRIRQPLVQNLQLHHSSSHAWRWSRLHAISCAYVQWVGAAKSQVWGSSLCHGFQHSDSEPNEDVQSKRRISSSG